MGVDIGVDGFCNAGAGPVRITLPVRVISRPLRRETPRARGAPMRLVPIVCVLVVAIFTSSLAGLLNRAVVVVADLKGDALASLLGRPFSPFEVDLEVLCPSLVLVNGLLIAFAALSVLDSGFGAGAVCEKRHGLRLQDPPGVLALSSGHRTAANSPSVGNIGILRQSHE